MATEVPALPEFVLDHLDQEVRVGDTIAYAALGGRSALISVSDVLGFQWSKQSWGDPELKIKVQGTDEWAEGGKKKPGYLIADYKRFVLLPSPA